MGGAVSSIPTVDISGALAGDHGGMDAAARQIDAACVNSGFFVAVGHGVPPDLVDETMAMARDFFRLPFEEKSRVAPPNFEDYRGFLGLDTTSLAATLGDNETPPDLCESFNVGRFDDPEIRARAYVAGAESTFCPNRWPGEPAGLRPLFEHYYAVLERLCMQMLPLFARALDLPDGWFADKVQDHTALLLFNWYPPVAGESRPGQLRRGAHTDYGAFTVVAAEQIPGLQIRSNGDWADVPMVPGGFVVNLGDLMARWTNDRWVSTLHRVVIPEGEDRTRDRMSVPFFFQPSYRAIIETIPTTITPERPARYEPVVSGEWIAAKSASMLEDDGDS